MFFFIVNFFYEIMKHFSHQSFFLWRIINNVQFASDQCIAHRRLYTPFGTQSFFLLPGGFEMHRNVLGPLRNVRDTYQPPYCPAVLQSCICSLIGPPFRQNMQEISIIDLERKNNVSHLLAKYLFTKHDNNIK